jgi:heparin binding hemagglutinin HbhA
MKRFVDRTMKGNTMADNPTIDELRTPLLAALGAADLALATVNELLSELRDRAGETRTDTRSRVEESRARLTRLQEDLPAQLRDLRGRFTPEELRSAAEGYVEAASSRYAELVERGEAALERLRTQQGGLEDVSALAEGYVDQAVELTQEALGTVASQTRAVGERAAKLVGIELPKKEELSAPKEELSAAPKKAEPSAPKKAEPSAPKKAPASASASASASAPAPAKKAPAKKAPAKKAPAKKAASAAPVKQPAAKKTPAKKTAAKKVTQK